MNATALIESVQRAYEHHPDHLADLVDPSTIELLGLTQPEVLVLCALLLAEGRVAEAKELLPEMKQNLFNQAALSLKERELIQQDEQVGWLVHFDGAVQLLRMQTDEEAQAEQDEDAPPMAPSPKLVLRPIREQVILLARQKGIIPVYISLFGKPAKDEYGIINLMGKELGREQAVLFLLEHAHQAFRSPAKELLPLARARAKGFRPVDAPEVEAQNDYLAAIAKNAREKHGGRR